MEREHVKRLRVQVCFWKGVRFGRAWGRWRYSQFERVDDHLLQSVELRRVVLVERADEGDLDSSELQRLSVGVHAKEA